MLLVALAIYCRLTGFYPFEGDETSEGLPADEGKSAREEEKERQRISDWLGTEVWPDEADDIEKDRVFATDTPKAEAAYRVIGLSVLAVPAVLAWFIMVPKHIRVAVVAWRYPILLGGYGIMSLLSFVMMAWDKQLAREGKSRISEATLHAMEWFGGFVGSFIAQRVCRHKTRSPGYQITFWLIVFLHAAMWTMLLGFGADEFLQSLAEVNPR